VSNPKNAEVQFHGSCAPLLRRYMCADILDYLLHMLLLRPAHAGANVLS
jgi:hypothetical protein